MSSIFLVLALVSALPLDHGDDLGVGRSMLGIVAAGTPLALAAAWFGWRTTFVMASPPSRRWSDLPVLVLVRDSPPGVDAGASSAGDTVDGPQQAFVTILRLPGLLRVWRCRRSPTRC